MIDLFLKFKTRDETFSLLEKFTYPDDDNSINFICNSHEYTLHEVGEILGTDGWHVNLRVIDPNFDISALEEYRVYPTTPYCVWA